MNLSDVTQDYRERAAITDFVRLLSCCAQTGGREQAGALFTQRWPTALHVDIVRKAVVAPGSTTDSTWAGPLMIPQLASGFVALVRSAELLGRLAVRRIPFNVRLALQSAPATYYWTAENVPKPVTKMSFASGVTLAPLKQEGIVSVTKELGLLLRPGTETMLQQELIDGLVAFSDQQFLDPAVSAIAGQRPASILAGLTPIVAGATLDATASAVLAAVYAQRPGAKAVLIASPATIEKLAATGNNDQARGDGTGYAHSVPLFASGAAGANLIGADPQGIVLADSGVTLDASSEATIESDSAPVGTAAAAPISLWQMGLVGFKSERFINYQALSGSVAYSVVP